MDAMAVLARRAGQVDAALSIWLSDSPGCPPTLAAAMQYSLNAGGKRLRPALVLECCAACDGSDACAIPAAAAIECIHTFSLIHDDLPAMDNDDLRRGRPTNHKVYGEAVAILAGDALLTLAFELLAAHVTDPVQAREMILCLARGTGWSGMIGGQVLDIEGESLPCARGRAEQIHQLKTAALVATACELGAIAAGAAPIQRAALRTYGTELGLAFQAIDDLLDVTASAADLGKATGKDTAANKQTLPRAIGPTQTRRLAEDHAARAIAALAPLAGRAPVLRSLADFVIQRRS